MTLSPPSELSASNSATLPPNFWLPPEGLEVPPRILWVPSSASSFQLGEDAVEVAELAGLHLDPWQQLVLVNMLAERDDGQWAAFEAAVEVSRQNGKGGILEARELAGLFLLGERLIQHTAHQFDTSKEAWRRLLELIESVPEFDRRVKRVSRTNGDEGIELKTGQRIRFRTRTKSGGLGFSGDCLIFDESMIISEKSHGALLPTLSARPNPQVIYTGSSVDKWVHEYGLVVSRIRERGMRGGDSSLAYFEWSAPFESPDDVTEEIAANPETWAQANPGLGIRITEEYVANERRSLDPRTFAVMRLGVGDPPAADGAENQVIDGDDWDAGLNPESVLVNPIAFAVDVTPDRSFTSIDAAGLNGEGKKHVEVVERRRGTRWAIKRIPELVSEHDPVAVVLDGSGPASSLIAPLEAEGVEVTAVSGKEFGQACGSFYDTCLEREIEHLGQPDLDAAIKGAAKRPLGDAWAWARKSSSVDISPLVAGTLALWGYESEGGESHYNASDLIVLS